MPAIRPHARQMIDRYIENAPAFAKPICKKLREIIHKAEPSIQEDWKWGPNFNRNGMVCAFGAFKKHVSFAFFQGALLKDPYKILDHGTENQRSRSMKFTDISQVNENVLIGYIQEAVRNNLTGKKVKPAAKELSIPADLKKALTRNKRANEQFEKMAYTYKKEYVQWIESAKKQETREKRLKETMQKIARGEKQNEKYMK